MVPVNVKKSACSPVGWCRLGHFRVSFEEAGKGGVVRLKFIFRDTE